MSEISNRKFRAFDINGKRLNDISEIKFVELVANNLAFWIKENKTARVITDDNLNEFLKTECIFCKSENNLSVIRGHKHKSSVSPKQKIYPSQFATVCDICKSKYRRLTPEGFKNWVNAKIYKINDFEKRYPNSRLALVSKINHSNHNQIIGYITPEEAVKMISECNATLINENIINALAVAISPSLSSRKTSSFRKKIEKYKKTKQQSGVLICQYCGENKKNMTVDHIIPLSRGGEHKESNFIISCSACNRNKNTMTEKEYKEYLKRMKAQIVHR